MSRAHDENVVRPSWAADGSRIYATSSAGLVAYPLEGAPVTLVQRSAGAATESDARGFYFEEAARALYPFAFNPYAIVPGGSRVSRYDTGSGESVPYIERPGGAFNPALSPDGRTLAYLNRDVQKTVLVIHDLATRRERVLVRSLDADRQEGGGFGGAYSNMAWHPDSRQLFLSYGGAIHAVDIVTGEARRVPFRAPVDRSMTRTMRFTSAVPADSAATRAHRWAVRTADGILYEALGDLWLRNGEEVSNLTNSAAHETSPVLDASSGTLYYASWTDDDHGAVYARRPGMAPQRLTNIRDQYGALALSRDNRRLAAVRGTGMLQRGEWLSNETRFELVILEPGADEKVVTTLRGRPLEYANFAAKKPPHVRFAPTDDALVYTEFVRDTLVVVRIGLDGRDRRVLHRLPHATEASVSPDLQWLAFREYQRSFLAPLGDSAAITSAYDHTGRAYRIDSEDGGGFSWSPDGRTVGWVRASGYYEKDVTAILAENETGGGLTAAARAASAEAWAAPRLPGSTARRTELSISFAAAAGPELLALTNVRVVTMNAARDVIENATILVRGRRIEAAGRDVVVPPTAHVFDLSGHTVIPGLVDAHAHPHLDHSALHVIEQRPPYLHAALAYGVTTMIEVYGNEDRDGWMADMLHSGRITGPRLFTTGSAIFGLRRFRPRMFRPIASMPDALEQLRWNRDHGAIGVKDYGQMTRQRRLLVASAARVLGLNVLSESWGDPQMNFTQLVDGVTGLEHWMGIGTFHDDVIRLWAATSAGITPTLLIGYGGLDGEGWFHQQEALWRDPKLTQFILPEHLMRLRRTTHVWPEDNFGQTIAEGSHRLWEAGVPVQLGAHGQMLGLDAHWELEGMVDGGFTPAEALEIGTIRGAEHHGLAAHIGSIEPGKLADLVVLRENPLEDIRRSRSIVYVVKDGVVHDGADAARVYPDPQPAGRMYFRSPEHWQ